MNLPDSFTEGSLRDVGFEGFLSVEELRQRTAEIPRTRGVYVVLRQGSDEPVFLARGTGGHFKGNDPNVSVELLRSNWVRGADVLYIGKAGATGSSVTLRSRIRPYLSFGAGLPAAHRGGRYIWQLAEAESLTFCWMETPQGLEPRWVEQALIARFVEQHGARPFANLVG